MALCFFLYKVLSHIFSMLNVNEILICSSNLSQICVKTKSLQKNIKSFRFYKNECQRSVGNKWFLTLNFVAKNDLQIVEFDIADFIFTFKLSVKNDRSYWHSSRT